MISKIEDREILLETGQNLDAGNLKERAASAIQERANARMDKLKFYEEAAAQDKEFQRESPYLK